MSRRVGLNDSVIKLKRQLKINEHDFTIKRSRAGDVCSFYDLLATD